MDRNPYGGITRAPEGGGRWRVRTGWNPLLAALARVSRDRVGVRPAVVLCARQARCRV